MKATQNIKNIDRQLDECRGTLALLQTRAGQSSASVSVEGLHETLSALENNLSNLHLAITRITRNTQSVQDCKAKVSERLAELDKHVTELRLLVPHIESGPYVFQAGTYINLF